MFGQEAFPNETIVDVASNQENFLQFRRSQKLFPEQINKFFSQTAPTAATAATASGLRMERPQGRQRGTEQVGKCPGLVDRVHVGGVWGDEGVPKVQPETKEIS